MKKDECKIIAIALQKGGVGKTTTALNLAAVLSAKSKVLVIDCDPQGNASMGLGVQEEDVEGKTIYEVLLGELPIKESIIKTQFGIDLIPANDDLSNIDINVIQNPELFPKPAAILKGQLKTLRSLYNYIFIDLPPSLGIITVNGLTACDNVLIPMQCEYFAIKGVLKLLKTIENVKEAYNPKISILGIVGTMYNKSTNLSSIVLQDARQHFSNSDIKVFDTTIYRSIKFAEAPLIGQPAILLEQNHPTIQAYRELAKEVEEACQI